MKNLVIVESPTKAKTLASFLGPNYHVVASFGHIRDLPKSDFGVDVSHNFEPIYVVPREKRKIVNLLTKEALQAKNLFLATDPDREGEAIAWHIVKLLTSKGKILEGKVVRIVFHEITSQAVKQALANPRHIDQNLVDAQQARRVLDRIVGYMLSPLLWKKVKRGLSAGRVQSVALRLIVEREREIEKFKPREYWTIEAELSQQTDSTQEPAIPFKASLFSINSKKVNLANEFQTKEIESDLKKAEYKVANVSKKQLKKYSNPPFTTSTLQQMAANRLKFSPKKTMTLAQELYEKGLITYMRTDSVSLADSAVHSIRNYIAKKFGAEFLPIVAKKYKVKSKLAQEAHEAIRPTDINLVEVDSFGLNDDAKKLYELIWQRTVACQMREALLEQTVVEISAVTESNFYKLKAVGSVVIFEGWRKVLASEMEEESNEVQVLPQIREDENLKLLNLYSEQHFTQPPDRYTEASLIKVLELYGIGRPSTYAPIISTILERHYVERENRKLYPTSLGIAVNDFLVEHFPDIVDISFTAEMEDELDEIARGEKEWRPIVSNFYQPFSAQIDRVERESAKVEVKVEETEEKCELCDRPMVIKISKFGKFLACSGFPECKNTKPLVEKLDISCPKDGGIVIVRKTRNGRPFYGCSNWPKCDFASWTRPS